MLSNANGVGEFLGEMRDRCFVPHDAFTVGEVFDEKPEELESFIGENGYFSSKFDFNETIFGGSEKAGTIAKGLLRKIISIAALQPKGMWALQDFYPTSLKTTMSREGSAITFRQETVPWKPKRCLAD